MNRKLIAVAAAVAAPARASAAQAHLDYRIQSQPPSSQATRALMLRGEAANARYGLGAEGDASAIRALRLRGEAADARYVSTASDGGSSARWGGFGIGAGV